MAHICRGTEERQRKGTDLVNSRRILRHSRRRPGSGSTLKRACLICAAAGVPVLVVGYAVATAHGGRATDTADVSTAGGAHGPQDGADGWGRGGYTMMPGPAVASPAAGGSAPAGGPAANAANAAATTSENWAGYASAGNPGQFTSVSASWTQPTVTCTAQGTFSSFWVGLDGDGTNTVEQTGTEADCDAGAATYQGWFEMFPNAPVFYNNPVTPGDAMSASVVANGGGEFTLTLTDATAGWTQTTNQASGTAQLGSAEVIAEAPSDGTVLPLSNFGTVSFANVTADGDPIGSANASALTMVSAAGTTEATPSALSGGNAFTVTWDSNGTDAAQPTAPATTAAPAPTATASPSPAAGGGVPGRHHHHHGLGD
jgi:Peptidase A4 family